MAKNRKLKAWHLVPISLIALILVAVFVWVGRGGFSTREVGFNIEGPDQIENGQSSEFTLTIENGSEKTLKDLNIAMEMPAALSITEGRDVIERGFAEIPPGETRQIPFSVVASSTENKARFSARLDYSPEGVSARFVKIASKDVVIGSLDASIIFDLPDTIFADQEIKGAIHIIPNSDIAASPLYLKLEMPENFALSGASHSFDFDTVWKLGELKEDQAVKREFRGAISGTDNNAPRFRIAIGILEGASFLELKSAEHTIEISESPLFLEQNRQDSVNDSVSPGETVNVRVSYRNRSEIDLEDAILSVQLPVDLVDTDTIQASGARIDRDNGLIEWDKSSYSRFRSIGVNEGGDLTYSFEAANNIEPEGEADSNKVIDLEASLRSTKEDVRLDGAVLQAEDTLSLKMNTKLSLQQSVYRSGGPFENTGPHPPQANELSTYTVRWELSNTTNSVRMGRVEAVLPDYAVWRNKVEANNEDVRYISSTNTVLWEVGDADMGLGYVSPQRVVEFQIGVVPDQRDVNNGVRLLEQTKTTGIDNFTSTFLEQDLGRVTPSE